jgi:hypothetical protein
MLVVKVEGELASSTSALAFTTCLLPFSVKIHTDTPNQQKINNVINIFILNTQQGLDQDGL